MIYDLTTCYSTRIESASSQRLESITCDEPLSSFAFNFKLRRYAWACSPWASTASRASAPSTATASRATRSAAAPSHYQTPCRNRLRFQRLKLQCDEPLSNSAFNFNSRRYNEAAHFLVGYMLGVPVAGYSLGLGKALQVGTSQNS